MVSAPREQKPAKIHQGIEEGDEVMDELLLKDSEVTIDSS